jgi:TDG/mug DNA glycosylase family protein
LINNWEEEILSEGRAPMGPIEDVIAKQLKVLFCGFNPSLRSGETGHHFANSRNRFWNILFRAELTPRQLQPTEDRKMLQYGYGLTNIVARPTKEAKEISKEEYDKGRAQLHEKIADYQPKVVCFVGKGVYQQFQQMKDVDWGLQQAKIGQTKLFVAPSSSGLVRIKLEDIIAIYRILSEKAH